MKVGRRLWLAVVIMSGSVSAPASAQTSSASATAKPSAKSAPSLISKGQSLFDDQRYEESVQVLSAALLRPQTSREDRLQIYKLLSMNYVTLGKKEEADAAMRAILVQNANYEWPPKESPRFRDAFVETKKKFEAEGRPGWSTEQTKQESVTIKHTPRAELETDTATELRAQVEDPKERIASAKLFARIGTRGAFSAMSARLVGHEMIATMPGALVRPPLVEYYWEAYDVTGLPVASRGDSAEPLRSTVPEPKKKWVLPLAIGGGVLGAAAIFGGLVLAGVFESPSPTPKSRVTISAGGP